MNWTNFQTYNDAPTKAFEILCNQLFENWCKEQYPSEMASFNVVNGSGGDGGVESYAVLSDGKVIGLQIILDYKNKNRCNFYPARG